MPQKSNNRFLTLVVLLSIALGIVVGNFYANHLSGGRLNIINTSSNKLSDLLHIIEDQYVDKIDIADLVEKSMPKILKELDPHSVYITAPKVEESMQDLKGSFSGIGIQFNTFDDTIRIIHVVKGGPSEHSGLLAGDRIIAVGDSNLIKLDDKEKAMKLLKGKKGSIADLCIVRRGTSEPFHIQVVRGDVPVRSIETVYMPKPHVGYIKINNFGETTYPEFLASLAWLEQHRFASLIIDLRGNLGGYMSPAVQIANEFLGRNRLIVYTEGRKSKREDYYTDGRGIYQNLPLVVLVDENTASASEILAGAIQDNDRGMIVGRRSFGKGLVQVPIEFKDGAMLRLTKARYYTPSGRCLQKPYKPGDDVEYELDLLERAEHGELLYVDSIKATGEKFKTMAGRTVYGGGGIIPDEFVPRDTLGYTAYFKDVYLKGLIHEFAYRFTDDYRATLLQYKTIDEIETYLKNVGVLEKFVVFAAKQGIKRRNIQIYKSRKLLEFYLASYIIDNVLNTAASTEFINREDPAMLRALELIEAGKTIPALAEENEKSKDKEEIKNEADTLKQ